MGYRHLPARVHCLAGATLRLRGGCGSEPPGVIYWFLKAAEAGSAQGQFMAGQAYFMGRGASPDPEKAFGWHLRVAEKGGTGGFFCRDGL